ncbi:hypothetical protein BASA50_001186 [Batrachochytrium salamandrivorans]|uniref:Mediator of RNA polymerase II transcription subunit 10 n=1 Tax=Batrachochytrium salamandrivorans TaxID=1357716 RepID=A0ABQ8ERV3_9FUNG|nr:hypothetical protein BASA60_011188 [Batrachochytrium salamandrivorans]KAH6568554.1 hypothetical protein BASA62_005351 [Batrachochytrium salamandrivorans]KAH6579174.1 hypothetical protein BASA61_010476 [Batrachochytrium salamandrivorans]KAH6585577.1 hypothetical protein BASA50_001186 [Batrachochytrium salamandrivorans]KAH9271349.1 hypothetical protein BASA83_006440 [Batrachochytrium salamandrivorans]
MAQEKLEAKLLETLDTLLKISMTVYDFQPESGAVLNKRIGSLVGCLTDLDGMANSTDIQVPINLLEVVENGINPDQFTGDVVQTLLDKNQKTNGRIESIKILKDEMRAQLQRNYPALEKELHATIP